MLPQEELSLMANAKSKPQMSGNSVPVADDSVAIGESFTYLGVNIHTTIGSESEIKRCTAITWNCMSALNQKQRNSPLCLITNYGYTESSYF